MKDQYCVIHCMADLYSYFYNISKSSMEQHHLRFPTSILRVDLHCCTKCPFRVKKALQEINGVYSIEIDSKNELVLVSGLADPSVLQKAIKNVGKKAELLVNEKDSYQAKNKLEKLRKNRQRTKDCRSEDRYRCRKEQNTTLNSQDSDSDEHDGGSLHAESKLYGKKAVKDRVPDERITTSMPHPVYGMTNNIADHGFGLYPQGGSGWFPGMLPPGYAMPYHPVRPYGYAGHQPALYGSLLPPPPPPHTLPPSPLPQSRMPFSNLYAVYSGQKDPPVGNSLYHSFSDENVKACTIV